MRRDRELSHADLELYRRIGVPLGGTGRTDCLSPARIVSPCVLCRYRLNAKPGETERSDQLRTEKNGGVPVATYDRVKKSA